MNIEKENNYKISKGMTLNFKDFLNKKEQLNEASLINNPGIPGQGNDKSVDYLSDVERRAKADAARKGITPRSGMELMRAAEESQRMQRGKEAELEALAEEVVRANYGAILDNVSFDIQMVRRGEVSFPEQEQAEREKEQMEEEEKENEKKSKKSGGLKNLFKKKSSESDKTEEEQKLEEETDDLVIAEIHKRKIANNIIQGEGKNTKHILHSDLAKNGLIRIFGREDGVKIHRLYDSITKIMESLDWTIPMEIQERMWKENPQGFAGSCKVDWNSSEEEEDDDKSCESGSCRKDKADKVLNQIKNDGDLSVNDDSEDLFNSGSPSVIARGIDFPMLIHESVKGIYELIASAGISKDAKIAKKVSLNADVLSNELEDLRYGPYIAADIRDFINVNPNVDKHDNIRESVFGKMIVLPANEFLQLIFGILKKTPEARTKVDSIVNECVEELDQYELGQHIDMNTGEEENDYEDVLKKEPKNTEPEVVDYTKMRTKDLQDLVDEYLDAGNFDKVREIGAILAERK